MTQNQEESSSDSSNKKTGKGGSALVKGVRWSGSSQVLQQVLNLVFSVVMARLLVPEDFGVLSMASVFTGVVFLVLDLGLGSALIQAKSIEDRQVSSVFWMNVAVGLLMTLAGMGSSWAIAGFYNTPSVQPIVMGLSINFLLYSLGSTQQALLIRQMNFKSLEIRNLGGQIFGTTSAIILAFMGLGVWSLVARILITGLVNVVLLWSVSGWRPSWHFRWLDVQKFIGFGNDILANNFLGYVSRNADNFLIGKFIGVTDLGYYALAYNVMRMPVQRFSQVLAQILFPALARLQEDMENLKRSWFRAVRLAGAVTIPAMLGLIAVCHPFVEVVYGQRWLPVVPVLQVLAITGALQSLSILNSSALIAIGKTRLQLKLSTWAFGFAMLAFVVGLPHGILGVATCFTIASVGTSAYMLLKTLEALGITPGAYFRNLSGVMIAAMGMELLVLAIALTLHLPPAPLLGISVSVGIAAYVLLLHWLAPNILQECSKILPKRFTKPFAKLG